MFMEWVVYIPSSATSPAPLMLNFNSNGHEMLRLLLVFWNVSDLDYIITKLLQIGGTLYCSLPKYCTNNGL